MIRVTGFFRWDAGALFNHDYYRDEHMRLVGELLAPLGMMRLESDKLFMEEAPAPGQLVAATSAYFLSLGAAQVAVSTVCSLLRADLHNFTTLQPEIHCGTVATHATRAVRVDAPASLWVAAQQAPAWSRQRGDTCSSPVLHFVRAGGNYRKRGLLH
jgi:hypothetical protein